MWTARRVAVLASQIRGRDRFTTVAELTTDDHPRVVVGFALLGRQLRPGRPAHGRAGKARQLQKAVLRIGMPQPVQMGESCLAGPVLIAVQLHHIALVGRDQGAPLGQRFGLVQQRALGRRPNGNLPGTPTFRPGALQDEPGALVCLHGMDFDRLLAP